jgi:hypothetical protein
MERKIRSNISTTKDEKNFVSENVKNMTSEADLSLQFHCDHKNAINVS